MEYFICHNKIKKMNSKRIILKMWPKKNEVNYFNVVDFNELSNYVNWTQTKKKNQTMLEGENCWRTSFSTNNSNEYVGRDVFMTLHNHFSKVFFVAFAPERHSTFLLLFSNVIFHANHFAFQKQVKGSIMMYLCNT